MTPLDLGPPHPTSRPSEPPVRVRIEAEFVIVTTAGRLDHDATVAVAHAIAGAVTAGYGVVLELDGLADPVASVATARSVVDTAPAPAPPGRSRVAAIGVGLLSVPTTSQPWTIDMSTARLCRDHAVTDRRFVPPSAWIGVRSVSIASGVVIAVTTDGDRLVTHQRSAPA